MKVHFFHEKKKLNANEAVAGGFWKFWALTLNWIKIVVITNTVGLVVGS